MSDLLLSERQRETVSNNEDHASEVTASLKWFNGPKGFGFVVPDGEEYTDAFLHITVLQKAAIQELGEGARMRCLITRGAKGAHVKEIVELIDIGQAPESVKSPEDAENGNGKTIQLSGSVKWFKPEKGFGFVSADDNGKDVFIHQTCLERHGLTSLEAGIRVSMEVKIVPKGREVVTFELLD